MEKAEALLGTFYGLDLEGNGTYPAEIISLQYDSFDNPKMYTISLNGGRTLIEFSPEELSEEIKERSADRIKMAHRVTR